MGLRSRNRQGSQQSSRQSTAEELEVYRDFVRRLTETCEAAARGDLEARCHSEAEAVAVPELAALHDSVNRVLGRLRRVRPRVRRGPGLGRRGPLPPEAAAHGPARRVPHERRPHQWGP